MTSPRFVAFLRSAGGQNALRLDGTRAANPLCVALFGTPNEHDAFSLSRCHAPHGFRNRSACVRNVASRKPRMAGACAHAASARTASSDPASFDERAYVAQMQNSSRDSAARRRKSLRADTRSRTSRIRAGRTMLVYDLRSRPDGASAGIRTEVFMRAAERACERLYANVWTPPSDLIHVMHRLCVTECRAEARHATRLGTVNARDARLSHGLLRGVSRRSRGRRPSLVGISGGHCPPGGHRSQRGLLGLICIRRITRPNSWSCRVSSRTAIFATRSCAAVSPTARALRSSRCVKCSFPTPRMRCPGSSRTLAWP